MNDLSPEDRELLVAGGRDDVPTEADRARVRNRLAARIGVAAGLGAATAGVATNTAAAAATGVSTLAKIVVVLAIGTLGAVGTAIVVTRQTPSAPPTGPSPTATASLAPARASTAPALGSAPPVSSEVDEREPSPPPSFAAPPPRASAPSAPRGIASHAPAEPLPVAAHDALAEETRLLRQADAATRGGDGRRALELLDEHARRFPRGVLAEERGAERVLALCAAGRIGEARAAATRFLADRPQSPLAGRVRASCGGTP
jgi:hypothetical protein